MVKSGLVKGVPELPRRAVKRAMLRLWAVNFAEILSFFAFLGLPGQRARARREEHKSEDIADSSGACEDPLCASSDAIGTLGVMSVPQVDPGAPQLAQRFRTWCLERGSHIRNSGSGRASCHRGPAVARPGCQSTRTQPPWQLLSKH